LTPRILMQTNGLVFCDLDSYPHHKQQPASVSYLKTASAAINCSIKCIHHEKTSGKPLTLGLGRKAAATTVALNPLSGLERSGCLSGEVWLPQSPFRGMVRFENV